MAGIYDDYTEEEMQALEDAGYFADQDAFFSDQQLAGFETAATGAAAGAAIGGLAGPGGKAAGGLIGGMGGLVYGELAYNQDQRAVRAAILRDAELQKELDAVDTLEQYMTATNVSSAGMRQESIISARQAGARGGLGEAATQDLAGQAATRADQERAKRGAAAIAVSGQTDYTKKRMILEEEVTRQELMDQALAGTGEYAEDFGRFAGSVAEIAKTADSGEDTAAVDTVDTLDSGKASGTKSPSSSGRSVYGTTSTRPIADRKAAVYGSQEAITREEQQLLIDQIQADERVHYEKFEKMEANQADEQLGEGAYDYFDTDFGFAPSGIYGDDNINTEGGFIEDSKEAGSIEEAAFNRAYTEYLSGEQERNVLSAGATPTKNPEEARKEYAATRRMIDSDVADGRIDAEVAAQIASENPEALIDQRQWKNSVVDHQLKEFWKNKIDTDTANEERYHGYATEMAELGKYTYRMSLTPDERRAYDLAELGYTDPFYPTPLYGFGDDELEAQAADRLAEQLAL